MSVRIIIRETYVKVSPRCVLGIHHPCLHEGKGVTSLSPVFVILYKGSVSSIRS